ncbi:hypothetical protein ACFHYQ_19970 [Sphaerimonospora cavernae]|uniref:DUF2637 domain-containing protein n=1 Tax=Sphaerimonospora cavernae TaxID=1740611 RepID=A0ABV6U7X8_9ACTN
MVAIAALTFTFSFGNCWALGLRLGVAPWLAPLVGPSVDLSVIGLLVGIRHMQLRGVQPAELRPARILLAFSGLATLALNIAEPLAAGSPGRAAYDSIPPLLLIGWAEVGPGLLSRLHQAGSPTVLTATIDEPSPGPVPDRPDPSPTPPAPAALLPVAAVARSAPARSTVTVRTRTTDSTARADNASVDDALLETARRLDTEHRARTGGRPISAETLRKELRIGAARARVLSKSVRR